MQAGEQLSLAVPCKLVARDFHASRPVSVAWDAVLCRALAGLTQVEFIATVPVRHPFGHRSNNSLITEQLAFNSQGPLMRCGIKLTVDYAFKRTFGTEENRNVLMHLLNSILAESLTSPIAEITLLNPFSGKSQPDDKQSIFDIKARDQLGREFIVEVQLYEQRYLPERLVFYWAKEYAGQLAEGDDYKLLKPVFVICITEITLFEAATKAHSRFQLVDASQSLTLTPHLEVHVIELEKFSLELDDLCDDEDRWLYFLRNSEDYDSSSLPTSLAAVPEIQQATGTLTMVAHTPTERELYEAELKALRDERSRLSTAFDKGVESGRLEGRRSGEIAACQENLVQLGELIVGPLTATQRQRILETDNLDQLKEFLSRIAATRSWDEILNPVAPAPDAN